MLSSLISRQLAAEPTYDRFAQLMDHWGYTWEAIKVPTADNYILTTFHITGKTGQVPIEPLASKGSVLIQHGNLQDATSWLTAFGNNKPFHLQLVDEGYDIWLGNNRGTEYSQGHNTLTADDPEFWNFDWTDMGKFDDPANILAIKEATKQDKIQYIGYSQGTAQMHYALSHDPSDFFGENLHRVIQLAPCFYPSVPDLITDMVTDSIMKFQEYGIYSLYDENWDQTLETICDNFNTFICDHYKGLSGSQPISVKSEQYWSQLGLTNGFYEPVTMEQWANGEHEGVPIDVSSINSVPMSFFIGGADTLCTKEYAYEYISQINVEYESIEIDFRGHSYFGDTAYTEYFMRHILEQLSLHW